MQNRSELTHNHSRPTVLTPDQLHKISDEIAMARAQESLAKMRLAEEHKNSLRDAFMSSEPPADALQRLMAMARRLAEQGSTEMLVLQFPASYLDDRGRMINNQEADWPKSLVGFAKRAFEFYEKNLKPHGYRARAKVLDYPDGMPGDVGLYLIW
jgi:hypothetical protein